VRDENIKNPKTRKYTTLSNNTHVEMKNNQVVFDTTIIKKKHDLYGLINERTYRINEKN
jgi:hypothetical protein